MERKSPSPDKYEIDDVVEEAAAGVPDEILGNAVKAYVVLLAGIFHR